MQTTMLEAVVSMFSQIIKCDLAKYKARRETVLDSPEDLKNLDAIIKWYEDCKPAILHLGEGGGCEMVEGLNIGKPFQATVIEALEVQRDIFQGALPGCDPEGEELDDHIKWMGELTEAKNVINAFRIFDV